MRIGRLLPGIAADCDPSRRDGTVECDTRMRMCARAFETRTDVCGKDPSHASQPPIVPSLRDGTVWEPLSQALRARLPSNVPSGQKRLRFTRTLPAVQERSPHSRKFWNAPSQSRCESSLRNTEAVVH
jgi:hypothetical protein